MYLEEACDKAGMLGVQGASSSATEALLARLDGCVHAGAGRLLQEAGNADGQPAAETPDQDAHVLRACRRILLQLTMLKVVIHSITLVSTGGHLILMTLPGGLLDGFHTAAAY